MSAGSEPLQRELSERLGADALIRDPAQIAPLLVDHRELYRGRAFAVVAPRDTAEVARLVCWCRERRVGLVPQGGNTGYCGGATPDETGSQVLLLMKRLNRIRAVDAANFSMTVEAGCVLQAVQRAATQAERYFPLSLGSQGSCQIGGNLATNAGGVNVLRYGMARDLVLGIEAVLADGSILETLSGLRKNNTGYDLKSLLVGSEGTLGVITAATLKLWPRQAASATAFVGLAGPGEAIELLARLRASAADRLSSFELLPRVAIELAVRHVPGITDPLPTPYPWYVLCETTSSAEEPLAAQLQASLEEASAAGTILDAALATSERVREAFWRLRETIPEAQRLAGISLKYDISLPLARVPQFITEASAHVRVQAPEAMLVCYGHAGDGNLHFNVNAAHGAAAAALRAREPPLQRLIYDLVVQFGGSISAEHGIGRLKRAELTHYVSPTRLATLRAIKRALDPDGIMNPGKLL